MMYNYHPYQLMGCNCTLELEQCLRDQTTSVLAEEIVETMFDQSDLRCLHLEKREENCVEWDDFFNRLGFPKLSASTGVISLASTLFSILFGKSHEYNLAMKAEIFFIMALFLHFFLHNAYTYSI